MLRRQKVPRGMIADGINLKVYKRYNWEASSTDNEILELKKRRDFAVGKADASAIGVLDRLSLAYEKKFLGKDLFPEYANS